MKNLKKILILLSRIYKIKSDSKKCNKKVQLIEKVSQLILELKNKKKIKNLVQLIEKLMKLVINNHQIKLNKYLLELKTKNLKKIPILFSRIYKIKSDPKRKN